MSFNNDSDDIPHITAEAAVGKQFYSEREDDVDIADWNGNFLVTGLNLNKFA